MPELTWLTIEPRLMGATVSWLCPDDHGLWHRRFFPSTLDAHAFGIRLRTEGCPNAFWFPDDPDLDPDFYTFH